MIGNPETRKRLILKAVVREYVRSAEPVGSGSLTEKYALGVSPATVRNDMAELEDEGLLEQPHTSAGRVPTGNGYRVYVRHFVSARGGPAFGGSGEGDATEDRSEETLRASEESAAFDAVSALREMAKRLAEMTSETVIVDFGPGARYFAGVSNMLSKPESREGDLVAAFTRMIDDVDRVMEEAERRTRSDLEVMIGEGPFGPGMSAILTRLSLPGTGPGPGAGPVLSRVEGMIGLVGPMRMDYDMNVALMRRIRTLFIE